jgi:hypothetical protein
MMQWKKTRKITGKGGEKNPEIYQEGRENISWKFPRQVDCGLARALLDTEISREFFCSVECTALDSAFKVLLFCYHPCRAMRFHLNDKPFCSSTPPF